MNKGPLGCLLLIALVCWPSQVVRVANFRQSGVSIL
jgi:hypothetical protein